MKRHNKIKMQKKKATESCRVLLNVTGLVWTRLDHRLDYKLDYRLDYKLDYIQVK